MKRFTLLLASFILLNPFYSLYSAENECEVFKVSNPDYKSSPLTGVTRDNWYEMAQYMLEGAFSYINNIDDVMKFPKQHDKTYPHNKSGEVTEILEGLCRTLFVATPLLDRDPNLVINNIPVAEYYRHHIIKLTDPDSQTYIKHRNGGGPSQILVEFGALSISLSLAPDVLWNPIPKAEKDKIASLMISYGDGPTVNSNWRFFNIFVLSFFKEQGYEINEDCLKENLDKALAFYRGQGWYNDAPAYDYYSMWAFQMYGPLWAKLYGNKYYPDYAQKINDNLIDLADNYPYMFSKSGHINMWGRSIAYRYSAAVPFQMLAVSGAKDVNYGWLRYISSSTLMQFFGNEDFMQERVPTLGFYKPFERSTQIYSCRGSVYWSGKIFMPLVLLDENNPFWTSVENEGPWVDKLKKGNVYNKFQNGSNLLITNYPNSGASEMRSWCHEPVAKDWQKFRSSENYNKLSYNTEFPWMADGENGEISMNYGIRNKKNEWEVLRLYTFKSFDDGIYRRDAVLETDSNVKLQLADIMLPDGILRVDKVSVASPTDIRLGHYSLAELKDSNTYTQKRSGKYKSHIISNNEYSLALTPISGWSAVENICVSELHPVTDKCNVLIAEDKIDNSEIYVTLLLWKKGKKQLSKNELVPVKEVRISNDKRSVSVTLNDNTVKIVNFE